MDALLRIEEEEKLHFEKLQSDRIAYLLKIAGWIYFGLSLIGGVILILSASEQIYVSNGFYSAGKYVERFNTAYLAFGIVGILSSIIILLICLGLALIIEQNIMLIQKKKSN